MDEFFKSLLVGNMDDPNQVFTDKLLTLCPGAITIEWYAYGSIHEAIFSELGLEKIARFTHEASLIDLKTNLKMEDVPGNIKRNVEQHGEIMSSILIQEGQNYQYEFVLRDKSMRREIIFTDVNGNVLFHKEFPEII